MRSGRRIAAAVLAVLTYLAAVVGGALAPPQASAASLVQVTNFGANPTNLQMYEYVPASVQAHPPILLALHYCSGSGPAFFSGTEFASLADRYGFVVIYPSVTRSNDCWDVSSPGALTHNGNSDPAGLISMIQYVEQHNNGDASRVYVTGASSGGMATNVMLGDYPDVFKAGAAFMGVPFGCFATTDGSMWNTACAQGQITRTPQQWGDLVRAADPGYTGVRPRMQLWHGTNDTTLYYANFGEEIKQWTNVLGVSQTPSTTDSPQSGWTHTTYKDASGVAQVDAYSIANTGHVLPLTGMAADAVHFFGLDQTGGGGGGGGGGGSGGGSGCTAAYAVTNPWSTGFTATVTVTNSGTAPSTGWKVGWTWGGSQQITNVWNGVLVGTGSSPVTITNASYNGSVAPNGSTSFGFQATYSGTNTSPTLSCTTS
jgi:acetylxylan esterase